MGDLVGLDGASVEDEAVRRLDLELLKGHIVRVSGEDLAGAIYHAQETWQALERMNEILRSIEQASTSAPLSILRGMQAAAMAELATLGENMSEAQERLILLGISASEGLGSPAPAGGGPEAS